MLVLVITRDEKWIPAKERVKISTINVRLETTVSQKEETFQVIIDVIKNSTCFKAFTISAEVPAIFMQQFWYTIKKVKDIESYEFLLANKKCLVDVEVFRKILVICPRVDGIYFAELPDDETTLTFLLSLGYKGPIHKHHSMYVDHMHQPWRTLDSIINKCLSSKTTSNDRLRKSRINILWGMFYWENVDYPELIWEDLAFQIDYRQLKKGRRENMAYLNDGVVSRLKFIRIGEDYQDYGLPISETMLTEVIKQSESYQMFIKYSTDPEPARKRTPSRRVVKKKVTISADDNIIPKPDIALELGKSMSLTKVVEGGSNKARPCYLCKDYD
ncbi:hypothetical protein Tco_0420580 [Tanacetum coccineum]